MLIGERASVIESLDRLGRRVQRRREALGLTQRQAAALVGCSSSTLTRVETGTQRPQLELLVRLADRLGLDRRELAELAGYPLPERLPELGPYIRLKFKDLPPRAFGEIEAFVEFVRTRYASHAPMPEGDESPRGVDDLINLFG